MKVLSFDVGIKNLAYCLLEKTNDEIHILNWGIVNISVESSCCHKVEKKNSISSCTNTARYINNEKFLYMFKSFKA